MSLSMIPERGGARVHRLVRWLLVGLIAAGIIGMHVLSEQNAGGGHGMVMDGHNTSAAMTQPASVAGSHHLGMEGTSLSVASATWTWSVPLLAPGNQGMSGSMAMCLLFLAAGAATIALILLARRVRWSTADLAARLTASWNFSRRGPPPPAAPPHSLCILRV